MNDEGKAVVVWMTILICNGRGAAVVRLPWIMDIFTCFTCFTCSNQRVLRGRGSRDPDDAVDRMLN